MLKKLFSPFFLLSIVIFLLSLVLICLKPASANASSYFIVENAYICYNSRTFYDNPYGGRCYDGNWRFNTSVKNIGDSSNANEPGVVNPDYGYGYYAVSSVDYGIVKEGFSFSVTNIILAPGEHKDFYQIVSGIPCNAFYLRATGSLLDDEHVEKEWKVIDIDSVGPCPAGPTATPTPAPPACPYTFSQTVSNGAYNLGTGYTPGASVPFTPPFTAGVKVIDVSAGTWSGSATLTCKLEAPGSVLLGETTTAVFSGGGTWRALTFPTVMNLTSATTYTLYCRKTLAPSFSAYWNYNTADNKKTYKFHLDYCQLTPTPTPTGCFTQSPGQPQLQSPVNGAIIAIPEVTLSWLSLTDWGRACPLNNNRYNVYLTKNAAAAADGNLTNDGLNPICNNNDKALFCVEKNLDHK